MQDIESQILAKEWFYPYKLPSGKITSTYNGGRLDAIHATRLAMMMSVLDARFVSGYQQTNAVDLACHQGYFSTQLAELGCSDILAVDARPEHVQDTALIAQALGHTQLRTQQSDVHALDVASLGQFDITLVLGLIYHLENPIGALRMARALCRGVCLVETQVVPNMSGQVDWGTYEFVRPLQGSFGIIDETEETHGPEASTTGICLAPSLEGLIWVLKKIGFDPVEVVPPPPNAFEQHRFGKRVMVAAYVPQGHQ